MNSSTLNIAMFSSGNSLIWWETKYVRVEVLIYWRVISIDEFGCTLGCLWRCLWILVATFRRLWIFIYAGYKFLRDVGGCCDFYWDIYIQTMTIGYIYEHLPSQIGSRWIRTICHHSYCRNSAAVFCEPDGSCLSTWEWRKEKNRLLNSPIENMFGWDGYAL